MLDRSEMDALTMFCSAATLWYDLLILIWLSRLLLDIITTDFCAVCSNSQTDGHGTVEASFDSRFAFLPRKFKTSNPLTLVGNPHSGEDDISESGKILPPEFEFKIKPVPGVDKKLVPEVKSAAELF